MSKKYEHEYGSDNMYGHVVDLLVSNNIRDGIHLDIGCGYAAIHDGLQKLGLPSLQYVGIDGNQEAVSWLKDKGVEAHRHFFGQPEEDRAFVQQVLNGRKLASISILDLLEHLDNATRSDILEMVKEIVQSTDIPLIISVPNITHQDISLKLMEGRFEYTEEGLLDETHLHFFTQTSLESLMREHGFVKIDDRDINWELTEQDFPAQSTFVAKGALLNQYLRYIKKTFDAHHQTYQFVRLYRHGLTEGEITTKIKTTEENEEVASPFLSVITRTQGKRRDALTETLLCLSGQSDTDFEILLLGHNVKGPQLEVVQDIVEDLPRWIRKKVRYIPVDGGTRTTPLNVGFSQAKGEYIAILDDDDLVFDNWVETFHELAKENPGAILHSYPIAQSWTAVHSNGEASLRAIGSPDDRYCVSFDMLSQIAENRCPPVSFACPRYAFQQLGIQFDEQLNTTEDWDFLMRTAFICGVADAQVTTSIYRLWEDYENSQTLHSKEEWDANRDTLRARFDDHPIILPKGYAARVIELIHPQRHQTTETECLNGAVLYVDNGVGFSENLVLPPLIDKEEPHRIITFPKISKVEEVQMLRLDPRDMGPLTLDNLSILVTTQSGGVREYGINDIITNGYRFEDTLFFLKSDPQIILQLEKPEKLFNVEVHMDLTPFVSDALIEHLLISNRSFGKRTVAKIKRVLRGK